MPAKAASPPPAPPPTQASESRILVRSHVPQRVLHAAQLLRQRLRPLLRVPGSRLLRLAGSFQLSCCRRLRPLCRCQLPLGRLQLSLGGGQLLLQLLRLREQVRGVGLAAATAASGKDLDTTAG